MTASGIAARSVNEVARLAGMRALPTLEAIHQRRVQLLTVLLFALSGLSLAFLLLALNHQLPGGQLMELPAFRLAPLALTIALGPYLLEKERQLARLTNMLLEDRSLITALAQQATADPLTGLANRRAVLAHLEDVVAKTGRVAVLFVDIDRFKLVNDTLGHAAGDAVLTEVARRIYDATRPEDLVGRLGGDEFVIVLTDADIDDAESVASRIRRALAPPVIAGDATISVGCSVGVATAAAGASAAEVLRSADMAMFMAKSERGSGSKPFETTAVHEDRYAVADVDISVSTNLPPVN